MSDVGLSSLLLDGEALDVEIASAITEADVKRTIDGAPTLSLALHDPKRTLLRSGIFNRRITCQVDDYPFELVQVGKSGNQLRLTLEDLAVAALRKNDTPRKVEGGVMSRVGFARLLLQETPWIPLIVAPGAREQVAKVELARGSVATENQAEEKEDTWTCLKRIFSEIGWRCFAEKAAIYVGPDFAWGAQPVKYDLAEFTKGVDFIDFDWDIGKPMASANIKMRSTRWEAPPATPIHVWGLGPADAVTWLVSSISRSLFTPTTDVQVKFPEPELPEPEPPAEPGTSTIDLTGTGDGKGSYIWPVRGTVTPGREFGKGHGGIDIAAPTGTPIVAAREGTVTVANQVSGYGLAVYISHGNKMITRYGHMSRITTHRGLKVAQGQKIGEVGATGNARGAHLHWEVRNAGAAINPRSVIGGNPSR